MTDHTQHLKATYWDIKYREWRPAILAAPVVTLFIGALFTYTVFPRTVVETVMKEVPIERVITKEVPIDRIITKEVIKEVPVIKEVVREVPVYRDAVVAPAAPPAQINQCPPGQHATFRADGTIITCFTPDPNRR